jgi:hypothetical protein
MHFRIRGWVALTGCLAIPVIARADYRAGFFDASKPGRIEYSAKAMTWTLRNQAVERVLQFDPKVGALRTTLFRDLRAGRNLIPLPNSEGVLSFSARLMEVPKPLSGWKMQTGVTAEDWYKPLFNDDTWKPITLPARIEEENKTWHFRCRIPSEMMLRNRAYALVLDRALEDEAEVYLDGELALKVTPNENPQKRTIEVDLLPNNRVVAIKVTGKQKPNGILGLIGISEVGTAPQAIDLSSNWRYMHHSITDNGDGMALTITLSGTQKFDGFDLDVSYQIAAGAEPTMAKWFTLTSNRQTRFLLDQVVYDRWMLPGSAPETRFFESGVFVASDPGSRACLMTAVLSPMGGSERSADGRYVAPILRPFYLIKPGARQMTPKSLTAFTRGPIASGAFLYQLHIGQYVAKGAPRSLPTVYNTGYGYGDAISAETCEKILPLASELGAKIFVLGNGWQSNAPNGIGKYGDWNVDRSPNKFPQGLGVIATMVRANKMTLGLWAAPICVSEGAKAALDRADSFLRNPDGSRILCDPTMSDSFGMCFTTGWEDAFGISMQQLCRELLVTYLRLDGALLYRACASPGHDHPLLHGLDSQEQHFAAFAERMQTIDRDFRLLRGEEPNDGVARYYHSGARYRWQIPSGADRQANVKEWYWNADGARRVHYEATLTRPAFVISGDVPCHLPLNTPDLAALEYHLTSVAATAGNLELHGQLEAMTPEERALCQKWVRWNEENREWLAYSQPLMALGAPWNPREPDAKPHADGVLHLRPALKGKYGFLCLWNPGSAPETPRIVLNPSDYFVPMRADSVRFLRIKDSSEVKFTVKDGAMILSDVTIAPRSWEIYEIRQK